MFRDLGRATANKVQLSIDLGLKNTKYERGCSTATETGITKACGTQVGIFLNIVAIMQFF